MLAAVAAAFDDDATLTVEAGTGTGKSLAYLLPAIAWSLQNRERVIVSTHTINLQEQLILNDLPFLTEQAGLACTTALIKGRGNYLCQRKAAQADAQGTLLVDDEHQRELADVLAWARTSPDGSLSDLAVRPHPAVWEQVVSENDNCLRARCPYYATCFFYAARRRRREGRCRRRQPPSADGRPGAARPDQPLRRQCGPAARPPRHHRRSAPPRGRRHQLLWHASDLRGPAADVRPPAQPAARAPGRAAGAWCAPSGRSPTPTASWPSRRCRLITERLVPRRLSLLAEAEQCFGELQAELESVLGPPAASGGDRRCASSRHCARHRTGTRWTAGSAGWARAWTTLPARSSRCAHASSSSRRTSTSRSSFSPPSCAHIQGRIAAFGQAMSAFVRDEPNTCRWIEVRRRARGDATLALHTAPIDVGPLLRRALFEPFSTVVLTSATLTVDRRFDYLHRRLGLDRLDRARPGAHGARGVAVRLRDAGVVGHPAGPARSERRPLRGGGAGGDPRGSQRQRRWCVRVVHGVRHAQPRRRGTRAGVAAPRPDRLATGRPPTATCSCSASSASRAPCSSPPTVFGRVSTCAATRCAA